MASENNLTHSTNKHRKLNEDHVILRNHSQQLNKNLSDAKNRCKILENALAASDARGNDLSVKLEAAIEEI